VCFFLSRTATYPFIVTVVLVLVRFYRFIFRERNTRSIKRQVTRAVLKKLEDIDTPVCRNGSGNCASGVTVYSPYNDLNRSKVSPIGVFDTAFRYHEQAWGGRWDPVVGKDREGVRFVDITLGLGTDERQYPGQRLSRYPPNRPLSLTQAKRQSSKLYITPRCQSDSINLLEGVVKESLESDFMRWCTIDAPSWKCSGPRSKTVLSSPGHRTQRLIGSPASLLSRPFICAIKIRTASNPTSIGSSPV